MTRILGLTLLLGLTLVWACAQDPDAVASKMISRNDIEGAREMYVTGEADVNAQYEDGFTVLMHVVRVKNEEFVEKSIDMLVSVGADLEVRDSLGRTALHYAVFFENEKAVEVLLRNGADPSPKDHNGLTPEQLANARDEDPVAALSGELGGSSRP